MTVEDLVSAVAALPAPDRQRLFDRLDALRTARPDPDPTSHRPVDAAPGRTAHDRACHLAGSAPGPADPSSNPAHIHGFGDRPTRP